VRGRAILLLFTLGGVSALVYEIVWMRSFRLVLGSSTRSAAVVLASYFAGMALGNLIGARLARGPRPLRSYGLLELAVGLGALGVLPGLALYRRVYPDLYAWLGGAALPLELAKLVLAFAVLAPPTLAMGATLPVIARVLVTRADHVARRTGLLYALNTLGASVGALAATFVLPPLLGLRTSVYLAVALNLLIGFVALLLREQARELHTAQASARERPSRAIALAAAISGFGTLALEVVFVRILSQRSEGSVYTFGLMLVIFLVCLALGALIAARALDRRDPWRFLASTQLAATGAILLSPVLFQLIPLLTLFSPEDSLSVRLVRFSLGSLIVLGPAVSLIGVVLPATWKLAVRSASGVGTRVGRLTGLNTLAGVAGSLCAGFVLLPGLGLARSLLVVAVLYALLSVLAFARGYAGVRRHLGVGAVVVLVTGWVALGAWRLDLQPLRPGERLLLHRDGEAATVSVTEESGHRVLKLNHTYVLGSSAAADREVRQGRLPLLLHPAPSRIALIGVATGMTTSAALDFPFQRAVALELVPGVVDALPLFSRWSRRFFADPRVQILVTDGRDHLRGTRERFDVIVSDLFVPWQAGTGDLYSAEHFEAVRERLDRGGLFAQWLPAYQLTLEELRSITATFLSVFPHTALWRNDFHPDQPLLALIGHRDELSLDPRALTSACEELARVRAPAAPFLSSPEGVGLLYVAGPERLSEWSRGAPRNTDEHPYIEYAAPRSLYLHHQRDLGEVLRFLAEVRPRTWSYPQALPAERPTGELFAAADLLHDASLARHEQNFEREYLRLQEVARSAGDLRAVALLVTGIARRYRDRGMAERSEALLRTLAEQGDPPRAVLVALAQHAREAGRTKEAIGLIERALAGTSGGTRLRRTLLELLEAEGELARAAAHARALLEQRPDDRGLRIDLASLLHRLGRSEEAAVEIARVRAQPGSETREATLAQLRRKGLGEYLGRSGASPR
jgi:spermidine synthase